MSEPVVTITLTKSEAETIQSGISDLLCWCRGFMAARGEDFHYDPMGTREARELNIKLKKAIEEAF